MQFDSLVTKTLVFAAKDVRNLPQTMHIGYGTDANYARATGISVISVAANNPHINLVFHIIASTINDADLPRFSRLTEQYPHIVINIYQYIFHRRCLF